MKLTLGHLSNPITHKCLKTLIGIKIAAGYESLSSMVNIIIYYHHQQEKKIQLYIDFSLVWQVGLMQ